MKTENSTAITPGMETVIKNRDMMINFLLENPDPLITDLDYYREYLNERATETLATLYNQTKKYYERNKKN